MAKKGKKYLEAAKAVDATSSIPLKKQLICLRKSTLQSSTKPLKLHID